MHSDSNVHNYYKLSKLMHFKMEAQSYIVLDWMKLMYR